MKKILIISPHFPPVNAADMHRVRQCLPYLNEMGWKAVTLAVDPARVEGSKDDLLLETIPRDADVIRVNAWNQKVTRKVGLGSVALRSILSYLRVGNRLLRSGEFDLVYFSTTMFPVLILGRYWKKRFGVPFVVDMQDPWFSEHYLSRPKHQRPPKFWFSFRLDKYLEPISMRDVDGIVSVSQGYCEMLMQRYPHIRPDMCSVIPFGGAEIDFEILSAVAEENRFFKQEPGTTNVVYVGRGGHDMDRAAHALFEALGRGLSARPDIYAGVRVYLIGTSYTPHGKGKKTLESIADRYGLHGRVKEFPSRVSYFASLQLLREADMLVVPGSTDRNYTASKIYPYILSRSPILALFHEKSSVVDILRKTRAGEVVTFNDDAGSKRFTEQVAQAWTSMLERLPYTPQTDWKAFEPYTSREMTRRQVEFFNTILNARNCQKVVRPQAI